MFVLHEIERILQDAVSSGRRNNDQQVKITLPAIERIDVNTLQLLNEIHLRETDIKQELFERHDPLDLEAYISNQKHLTIDTLFTSNMKSLVLDRLAQIPEGSYPAARLMICDDDSYRHLLKFQYFTQRFLTTNNSVEHNYLLYKRPYCITAIVLLSDIVNLLDQVDRPIARFRNRGEDAASFDYTIIKQIFPYLRITDLVVVLAEIGSLRLRTYTTDAIKSHQVIQFLTHFARSTQLIELLPIKMKIGQQHLIYDNVVTFHPSADRAAFGLDPPSLSIALDESRQSPKLNEISSSPHLKPTLGQLSYLANRLHQLIAQLDWNLESITFRAGDPNGFTKIFAHILDSVVKSRSESRPSSAPHRAGALSLVPVRVLVLDRYFDLQGLLRHTERYGSFLEQEMGPKPSDAELRLDKVDSIDRVLHFEKLTDVLKTILEYSTTGARIAQPATNQSATSIQAIRRHLDMVKSIYKSMSEGYLLVLKLESSLIGTVNKLRSLSEPLSTSEQDELAERIDRVAVVLKQLAATFGEVSSSRSITPMDALRVGCILMDTINMFLYLYPPCDCAASRSMLATKASLVSSKEFKSRTLVTAAGGSDSQGTKRNARRKASLSEVLTSFDDISYARCANRATATLEEIIEQHYERKLDSASYPHLKVPMKSHGLVMSDSRHKTIVLILGSISYDELIRIKLVESSLMARRNYVPLGGPGKGKLTTGAGKETHNTHPWSLISGDILLPTIGIIRPDQFLESL